MINAIAIHRLDIIDLFSTYPDGIRLSQLMKIVGERSGRMATFHTCSAAGMNLDELIHFLEARRQGADHRRRGVSGWLGGLWRFWFYSGRRFSWVAAVDSKVT